MQPFSREQLQGMKSLYDEQIRLQFVDHVCRSIHHEVLEAARQGQTTFEYDLYRRYGGLVPGNIRTDIMEKLTKAFPDCDVSSQTITTLSPTGDSEDTVTIKWT
jgi:hypothetical protein